MNARLLTAKPPTGPRTWRLCLVSFCKGRLIMPTDVSVASECKRKAAQVQTQIEITVVLAWIMIGLVMLVLLFADQSFSKATIELMCLF
jgi:hypothetical protein